MYKLYRLFYIGYESKKKPYVTFYYKNSMPENEQEQE